MSAHKIFSGVLQPSITAKWFNKPIQAWKHRCCLRNVMQSKNPPKTKQRKRRWKNTKRVHIRLWSQVSWVKVQQMIYAITYKSVLFCYFSFPVTFTLTWFDVKMKMISFQNRFPSIQFAREGTHTSHASMQHDKAETLTPEKTPEKNSVIDFSKVTSVI